jgi:hypothetical protein
VQARWTVAMTAAHREHRPVRKMRWRTELTLALADV